MVGGRWIGRWVGGCLPRTRLIGLVKLKVNSIGVTYKQSRQLANVKIYIILNTLSFSSQTVSSHISGSFSTRGNALSNSIY